VSGPQVSEGWHGVRFARPLARTREYVEVVRAALAREGPLEYRGEEFRLPLEGSELGRPLKLLAKPVQDRIPIYLGAIGPKSVEQAARIADGWLPFMFSPERADELLEPFRGTDVDISPVVMVCVDEDRDRARDLARPWLALYMGGMGAKKKNFYVETAERFGHGESARRCQELFQAGDREGAAAALSDELIEGSAICCAPGELDDRLAEYERAGATTLLAMPFGDRPRIVEALAAAARGAAA
jgi:F420-dependent oxidoreductase-like protein